MGNKLTFSKNIKYWLIPISAVVAIWCISFIGWSFYEQSENSKMQIETEITGEQIKLRLESWVDQRIEIVESMATYWSKQDSINVDEFTYKAEEMLSWIPGLQALNWVDDNWIIDIVVPLEGNKLALGKNLRENPNQSVRDALSTAQNTKKISRTTAIELLQGGKGFTTYYPVITKNGNISGYINGVFKVNKLIENCFSEPLLTERFTIGFYEDNHAVFATGDELASNQIELMHSLPVQFVDKNLLMKIVPTEKYIKESKNYISYWILVICFLSSLGLGILLRISILNNFLLRNSEERFRTVVENAGDSFFLIGDQGKIVDVNPQACAELQYTTDELKSMNIADIDENYKNGEIKLAIGDKVTFETEYRKKDGTTFPVEIRSGSFEIKNEKYLLCLSRNISESKKLQELETRSQRLESAGQVAGQVAHDFNNLLAPLIAYPEFILELLDDKHPAIEYVQKIEKSANQIAEINQQLLTLGRRGHYNQQIINLNELIKQVVGEVNEDLNLCSVETHFEENILFIKGGYSQIVRILTNLLHNSFDAIDENGKISVKSENYYLDKSMSDYYSVVKGEYVKLTVTDNGHGISEEILPTIFDPFVSTKKADKKRGSGLGLSIVDSVMKDHKGFIDVKSKIGHGTEFFLYFPITREEMKKNSYTKVYGGNEKVLIVDDDLVILEVTQKILELLGYFVKTAETGSDALQILQNETFDLLILDMIIPNSIDGTEIFKRALEFNANQKAIIVSGFTESKRVNEAMRLGVDSFIKKPFTKEIISKAIRDALKKETSIAV